MFILNVVAVELAFAEAPDTELVVPVVVGRTDWRTLDFMDVSMRARISLEVNIFTKKIRNPCSEFKIAKAYCNMTLSMNDSRAPMLHVAPTSKDRDAMMRTNLTFE